MYSQNSVIENKTRIGYNRGAVLCPVGLMDKTIDSGSINVGSIPTRGAIYTSDCVGFNTPLFFIPCLSGGFHGFENRY